MWIFSVYPGEITGIVGESGSGKSVMSQSILRLKEHDTSVRCEGEILFEKRGSFETSSVSDAKNPRRKNFYYFSRSIEFIEPSSYGWETVE